MCRLRKQIDNALLMNNSGECFHWGSSGEDHVSEEREKENKKIFHFQLLKFEWSKKYSSRDRGLLSDPGVQCTEA